MYDVPLIVYNSAISRNFITYEQRKEGSINKISGERNTGNNIIQYRQNRAVQHDTVQYSTVQNFQRTIFLKILFIQAIRNLHKQHKTCPFLVSNQNVRNNKLRSALQ